MKFSSFVLLFICLFLGSCQEKTIEYQKTESGLRYYFFKQKTDIPKGNIGDIFTLNTSFSKMSDSVFLNTQTTFLLNEDMFNGGFPEALSMLREGDSASFILNIDTFYGDYNMGIPDFLYNDSFIKVNVGVQSILSPEGYNLLMKEKEKEATAAFVKRKGWNVTTDPESGIQYEITSPNPEGAKIEYGDFVGITYFYYTLNEKPFARIKEGDLMRVEVGDSTRIPGISKALSFTREGEVIRAILPYEQAFGVKGFGAHVAPYTTIVIELELVTLERKGSEVETENTQLNE